MNILLFTALSGFIHLVAAASETCTFDTITPSPTLTWCPCGNGFYCSRLDVPLDYQNPNLGRASVPLLKYPALSNSSVGPYQGMILLNPGGPGGSGISEGLEDGVFIQSIVGTNWDIVGFDTRGMWLSEPVTNCSSNITANRKLGSRSVPRLSDDYFTDLIEFTKEVGEQCERLVGGEKDAGPHMSTATVARDMLSIVNAFGETEESRRASKPSNLLNYYGISYGTFLGQTFASMFPEKVGNVVLDGNVSPAQYLSNFTYPIHLDGVNATFFLYCHAAGPSECSYYTGSTPKDIYNRFNQSFVQIDPRKAEAENWSNATELESALLELKVGILTAADAPFSYFILLPQVLLDLENAILAQNISAWTTRVSAIFGTATPMGYSNPEYGLGVQCSDQNNSLYGKTLQDIRPDLEVFENISIIGEVWSHNEIGCTGWSVKASEIFAGPFGGDTATPILFVSNTYDANTPIQNAISSAPNYKNAQVLTIDGTGHTTVATKNACGFGKIGAYFQTTALPGNDSFCPLETGQFNILLNGTLKDNLDKAGLSNLVQ